MPKPRTGDARWPNRVTGYPSDEVYALFDKVLNEYPDFGVSKHLNAAMRWYARDVLKYGIDAKMNPLGHVNPKK